MLRASVLGVAFSFAICASLQAEDALDLKLLAAVFRNLKFDVREQPDAIQVFPTFESARYLGASPRGKHILSAPNPPIKRVFSRLFFQTYDFGSRDLYIETNNDVMRLLQRPYERKSYFTVTSKGKVLDDRGEEFR